MGWFDSNPSWYAAGLAFECTRCGGCCAGPNEGFVYVSDEEIAAIASFLGISPDQMRSRYVRKSLRRLCLVEKENHDCIFLISEPGGDNQAPSPIGDSARRAGPAGPSRRCAVYALRPRQCRTWPFWPRNLAHPDHWSQAAQRCPGVNRGRVHSHDEIQAKLNSGPYGAESLAALVRQGQLNGPLLDGLREIYRQVDAEVSARGLRCLGGGACCKFDRTAFRLYVSTAELALLAAQAPPDHGPAAAMRCAYQQGPRCAARDRRPLGCRVYFCRADEGEWSARLYEAFHGRLRQLHDRRGLEYRYGELTRSLALLNSIKI